LTEFGTYTKYYTPQEAGPLVLLLESNNIPFKVIQEVNQLDPIIIGDTMDPMFIISIPVDRFNEVTELVEASMIFPDSEEFQSAPVQNSSVQNQPEHLAAKWLILGYLISFLAVAGIFAGLTLVTSTKRLQNGEKIKLYDAATVKHGRIMLCIGIIMTAWFIFRVTVSATFLH
jgi:hypothetical protein